MTATTASYRSTAPEARESFARLLLAEWTKLRSVPRWLMTLALSVLLTLAIALLSAAGHESASAGGDGEAAGGGGPASGTAGRDEPPPPGTSDQGRFVHRTLRGDGSLVARVTAQAGSHPGAKAGLMIRGSLRAGAPYAAVVVTPRLGVRMATGYRNGGPGRPGAAPRWLKLTRAGGTVTGYESADGRTWNRVGSVRPGGLGAAPQIGMLVASPDDVKVKRLFGGEMVESAPTDGRAAFDGVRVEGAAPGPDEPWRDRDRSGGGPGAAGPDGPPPAPDLGALQAGRAVTLAGSGDVGPDEFASDETESALSGVLAGLIAIVALGALFVTSEYRRGMIRTTLAASPRRGRVLAAKATVAGAVSFAAGLVAAFGSLLLVAPLLRSNGLDAPSLADGTVLRAAFGTAALLGLIAVLAVCAGTILRHGAAAISLVLLLLLVPYIAATGLPLSAARWVERLSPAAGFEIQRTVPQHDAALGPWAGLGVLCAFTAAAYGLALWRIRRSDA